MDSSINYNEWFKLDNAAKIFPAVSTERNSNVFRISAHLYENIQPAHLQAALEKIMPRFPSFAAKLRKGLFWYFLDHNANAPLIREESPYLYRKIHPQEERGFLFRVSYYQKRVSLEMFHTLSDGYGGIEFLKSLIFHYLELCGKNVKAQGMVKTANSPYRLKEIEDSFFLNYEKSSLSEMKDEKAYNIPGVSFIHEGSGLILGQCKTDEIYALSKEHGCTVGEFITAVYINALINSRTDIVSSKKPLIIFVPVNLRKYYNSETLRNFSSFVKIRLPVYKKSYSFSEIVETVRAQMKAQLTKEVLSKRMSGPVSAEKKIYFRLVPLFIKIPVLKLFYNILGEKLNTTSISNLGRLELPSSMIEYVDKFDLSTCATAHNKINAAFGSYNGKFVISFTRSIMEADIIRAFFDFFKDKIEFFITSNSWEEENFISKSVIREIKNQKSEKRKEKKTKVRKKNVL